MRETVENTIAVGNPFLTGRIHDEDKLYWNNLLRDELELAKLPPDFSQGDLHVGGTLRFDIPEELLEQLNKISKYNDHVLFILLLSGIVFLIQKYMGSEKFLVGMPPFQSSEALGQIANLILPIKAEINRDDTVRNYLSSLKQTIMDADEKSGIPIGPIMKSLNYTTEDGSPVMDIIIALDTVHQKPSDNGSSNLLFFFNKSNEKLSLEVTYSSLYRKKTISKFFNQVINCLSQIINMNTILKEIKFVNDIEEPIIGPVNHLPNKTVIDLFEEAVESMPDHIAIMDKNINLSYSELQTAVVQLADTIAGKSKPTKVVAIMLEHSAELIMSMLAVLKVGACYVPIDPSYPKERVDYILEDSGASLLITKHRLLDNDTTYAGLIIDISNVALDEDTFSRRRGYIQSAASKLDDPAYIIYTSGSTGRPKGVVIKHLSLANYVSWAKKTYLKGQVYDFPLYSSVAFDLTITSIYLPLISGGKIIIYDGMNPTLSIRRILSDNQVNIIKTTPAHLEMILEMKIKASQLQTIIVGGEQFSYQLAEKTHKLFGGGVSIYNEYGPTEATVGCMIYKYNPEAEMHPALPIGFPIDNSEIYLLDDHGQQVLRGAVGMIYVSGSCLAEGYINNLPLTKSKFIDHVERPGEKMYQTGDIAKRLEHDGLLYLGRRDTQIKIRGYRIEPGDVEARLSSYPEVGEVAVVSRRIGESNQLCAYFTSDADILPDQLKEHLSLYLPQYMVPSRFIRLERLPLNTNGKVDRKQLAAMDLSRVIRPMERKSELEHEIYDYWVSVLGHNQFNAEDSFFEVGGDSIRILQLHEKIESRYPDRIKVTDLFSYTTIRKIASYIERPDTATLLSKSLKLPDEYFIRNKDEMSNSLFEFEMSKSLLTEWLLENPEEYSANVESYFIGIFIILLSKLSGEDLIPLYMMHEKNMSLVEVNVKQLKEFKDIFPLLHRDRVGSEGQRVDDLTLSDKGKSNEIKLLFILGERCTEFHAIQKNFDFKVEITERTDSFGFVIEIGDILNRNKVKSLLGSYTGLQKLIYKQMMKGGGV